jgi:hypothetical protein
MCAMNRKASLAQAALNGFIEASALCVPQIVVKANVQGEAVPSPLILMGYLKKGQLLTVLLVTALFSV